MIAYISLPALELTADVARHKAVFLVNMPGGIQRHTHRQTDRQTRTYRRLGKRRFIQTEMQSSEYGRQTCM